MQQNTITETPKSVTITTADIDRLIAGIAGVRTVAGRTVVHGLYFDTDAESITDNVLATVEIRLIRNWAHTLFPDQYEATDPDEPEFDDDNDPDVQRAYEDAGF